MHDIPEGPPRSFGGAGERQQRQIPDNLWHRCRACRELTYTRQWEANAKVCTHCGYHDRLAPREWVALLLDAGSWHEYDADLAPGDPLAFVSLTDSYAEKLGSLQASLDALDAAGCGTGTIAGRPLVLAIHDFAFMGGSMGTVVGEKLANSAERAAALRVPLLTINTSGGARMHEGVFSLMQMAKVSVALARLGAAGQPHISLLVDPCYGGVLAAHASSADVLIAEPGARIGFAGPRVIEQTMRQKLPAGFQSAEFLLEHGMIDMVTPRQELRRVLSHLLELYGSTAPAHAKQLSSRTEHDH